jgi:hypothetical protein
MPEAAPAGCAGGAPRRHSGANIPCSELPPTARSAPADPWTARWTSPTVAFRQHFNWSRLPCCQGQPAQVAPHDAALPPFVQDGAVRPPQASLQFHLCPKVRAFPARPTLGARENPERPINLFERTSSIWIDTCLCQFKIHVDGWILQLPIPVLATLSSVPSQLFRAGKPQFDSMEPPWVFGTGGWVKVRRS